MKEHYVSHEQSVKLKELGFDWEVNHCYYDDELEEICDGSTSNYDNCNGTDYIERVCSAPTLAQAQAWMREKHHLSVEPICNMVRQWNVNVCKIDNFGTAVFSKMNLDTYESALSAGLDKAIELLGKEVNNGM